MQHRFVIVKQVPASRANVIANYLDLEHLPVHHGIYACRVLSETEHVACFEMTSKVGPFPIRNVHYFEFRPPHQIFHAVKSPLGPMYVLSTVEEFDSGTAKVRCEVTVETTIEMSRLVYGFRKVVERLLRHVNQTILAEDRTILDRRQALFGDFIEDYLRDQQHILFKEAFRKAYSRRSRRDGEPRAMTSWPQEGASAVESPSSRDRPGLVALLWAGILAPLLHRFGRGEGALLAVNLSLILLERPGLASLCVQAAVSAATLALLYGLNDVYDCSSDVNDAGKNQALVRLRIAHRRYLFGLLAFAKVTVVVVALVAFDARSAVAISAVFLVNLAYSRYFKGRPVLDVPWVCLWGLTYAMIPASSVPTTALMLVGVATGISHVFQIMRDQRFDRANAVRTSAVFAPWLPFAQMLLLTVLFGLLLLHHLGPVAAATAVLPALLACTMSSNQQAWLMAKGHFAIVWLMVLLAVHEV